jgi:hypothetical protein
MIATNGKDFHTSEGEGLLRAFLMHVGHPGHVDIPFTVTRRRTAAEILDGLRADAPARSFFESDADFLNAFPDGRFHCWGIPPKAKSAFEETRIGDLILFAPWIGVHMAPAGAPRLPFASHHHGHR